MNISQIQESLKKVLGDLNRGEFIYELLNAYGKPKASISRLKNGTYNLSKNANEVLWKKEVFFKYTSSSNLHSTIDGLRNDDLVARHKPRFLIVTDFDLFLAIDTKTQETLDISLDSLDKSFDFFLPWANMEKAQHQNENPADVKAAEKMAKLYDEILKDNPAKTKDEIHNLNVFLTRLLFCFFAEDTEIFPKSSFTHSITSHTQQDGSDLDVYLSKIFEALNTQEKTNCPDFLKVFPYVNGGLFTSEIHVPKFSRRSRIIIIECGELDWSAIHPDIFGSMFQAVVHVEQRSELGMHYTSVPNIIKVIKPLFLDDLYDEFEDCFDSTAKLEILLLRIERIKFFDPACGSGNFLIIAYRELRILEMKILQRINEISKNKAARFSNITLTQFYGIEIDDFAHEIAILSLWLAEHQMNLRFKETFGQTNPLLPLKIGGHITCANAATYDWDEHCPKKNGTEIYIFGNPPYQGAKKQTKEQKSDMTFVFKGSSTYKNLDYICTWFHKASLYIQGTKNRYAFVSTNSIVQGDLVSLFWTDVLELGQEIQFAYKTFKWSNNAKKAAGVSCVIIGVANKSNNKKWLFENDVKSLVFNINPYLADAKNLIISKRKNVISELPTMVYGNMPLEGGHLKLNNDDVDFLLKTYPHTIKFIKPLIGGDEFLKGTKRWCLWIEDNDLNEAIQIPFIEDRISKVRAFRETGGDVAKTLINKSHQFRYRHLAKKSLIIIPCTSSEKREYLQCGLFDSSFIALNSAQVIYDADIFVFGVLSSKMHIVWTKATAGCLESRIRYSNVICYNNFPFPKIDSGMRKRIESSSLQIISVREAFSEKTVASLYDPEKMPKELLEAHQELDFAVEHCYSSKPFLSDSDRLECMFNLYEKMTFSEKSK
ncbi:COG1002 Type II restriction enzyme, methylase subunits [Methylophilaceae bacterium]